MTDGKPVPYLRVANVFDGYIDFSDVNEMPFKPQEIDRFRLIKGDILLNEGQSVELVGRCAMFMDGPEDCCYQNTLIRYRAGAETDPHFALQLFRYCQHTGIFSKIAVKTNSIAHLGVSRFAELELPFPPYQVQVKIAEILKSWDTAIQKTEQLIAAKERSSKALMQRVFRTGFYPRRRLSELTHRITRKNVEGDGHPLTISGAEGLVSQSRYFGKRIAAERTEHYTLLKRGEYAYNKSYSAGYPLGAIKRLDAYDEGIVSTLYLCFALNDSKALISDYFVYFCEAGGFNHQIYQVAQEGARNHGLLNVTAEDFFSMTMPIPPHAVQERVVKALGAAMQELALLRNQLAALKIQKRGLMQKLLTGQGRLPVSALQPEYENL